MASNGLPAKAASPPGSPARSASVSLQAAATMNAGLQREPSPRSSSGSLARQSLSSQSANRRRSNVLLNLQLNDPSIPGPGEMVADGGAQSRLSPGLRSRSPSSVDPSHHRAPSLGELHQELEAEQESQVNRLLQVIRQQQLELQRIQAAQGGPSADETSAVSDRSSQAIPTSQSGMSAGIPVGSYSRSPVFHHPRSSMDLARRSRTPSRGASPRLRATSISQESGEWVLGMRDESAFYQAETQMLVRENQMLKHRIRELEKQLGDSSVTTTSTEPVVPSQLAQTTAVSAEGAQASK
ncbi:hypothetical protein VHEMI03521 [[Torrubiella] hemipterigena]|uniref:Uncharacterized protein n=1 Tax=[Torrubiella] hemipterigena TaxID=1531966 RepID=A0A0A1TB13_9HYPO|nr:hypothetical protein VHEMI03521 [[Torrubiella] hemipterigena]